MEADLNIEEKKRLPF